MALRSPICIWHYALLFFKKIEKPLTLKGQVVFKFFIILQKCVVQLAQPVFPAGLRVFDQHNSVWQNLDGLLF